VAIAACHSTSFGERRKFLSFVAEMLRPFGGGFEMSAKHKSKRLLIALAMEVGREVSTKRSSLTKFVCGCTRAYSEPDFQAQCHACGKEFVRDSGPDAGASGAVVRPTPPVLPARLTLVAEAA
jgi:ribosomal protein S27E